MVKQSDTFPGGIDRQPSGLAAEVHLATETLLGELLDYMLRLPAHAMTAKMVAKVQAHLADPTTQVVRRLAESDALAHQAQRQNRHGASRFMPDGAPVLMLSVGPQEAVVSSPAAKTYGGTPHGRAFAAEARGGASPRRDNQLDHHLRDVRRAPHQVRPLKRIPPSPRVRVTGSKCGIGLRPLSGEAPH